MLPFRTAGCYHRAASMDPASILSVSSLTAAAAKALVSLLKERAQPLLIEAQTIAEKEPESKQSVRDLFGATKQRLQSAWMIGIIMTVVLFTLFVSMVVTAVVSGLVLDKPMYSVVFGGISVASLLTVLIWKPYEMTFGATIIIQRMELILATLEWEWIAADQIPDAKQRAEQIRKINRATLDEMAKLTPKRV